LRVLAGQRQMRLLFSSDEEKEKKRKKAMTEQANYLVSEIGKLKGSIVKIGQMMALYGEHFCQKKLLKHLIHLITRLLRSHGLQSKNIYKNNSAINFMN
jgi:predicted unusual protein kinase regulating ubiquinone biosynthesis (AarF/ABC1/UbiB family)